MANALTPMTSSLLLVGVCYPLRNCCGNRSMAAQAEMLPFAKVWHIFCLKLWSRLNKTTFITVKSIASLFVCHSTLLLSIQLRICNILEN